MKPTTYRTQHLLVKQFSRESTSLLAVSDFNDVEFDKIHDAYTLKCV